MYSCNYYYKKRFVKVLNYSMKFFDSILEKARPYSNPERLAFS